MERVTSENINRLLLKFIDQLLEIAKVCQKIFPVLIQIFQFGKFYDKSS